MADAAVGAAVDTAVGVLYTARHLRRTSDFGCAQAKRLKGGRQLVEAAAAAELDTVVAGAHYCCIPETESQHGRKRPVSAGALDESAVDSLSLWASKVVHRLCRARSRGLLGGKRYSLLFFFFLSGWSRLNQRNILGPIYGSQRNPKKGGQVNGSKESGFWRRTRTRYATPAGGAR